MLAGVVPDEVFDQQRNVVTPVPQGRHRDGEHIEAEKQILAEIARPHLFAQVDIGRGHDAHIHLDGARAADALDLPLLQCAQQLALRGERQRADLVQEQRAAIRPLEPPRPLRRGSRIGAFLDAEQLRFHQRVGYGGAVDRDERPVAPGA